MPAAGAHEFDQTGESVMALSQQPGQIEVVGQADTVVVDRHDQAAVVMRSGQHGLFGPRVPGDVEQSALGARVTTTDDTERMPPEGKPLSSEEVETLKRWIKSGAAYQKHWAFVPPQRQEPPVAKNGRVAVHQNRFFDR